MATLLDVSNAQGFTIDWKAVHRAGIDAVWMKATEGLTFSDGRFHTWREQANSVGIRVGAYHFARPDLHPSNPEEEAAHFCAVVGKLGRTDILPVLDYEIPCGLTTTRQAQWIESYNHVVRRELGRVPLFYSYAALIQDLRLPHTVGSGLWLASYGRNDGHEWPYSVPAPWKHTVAHQFSSRGQVAGVHGSVDLSHAKSLKPLLAHPIIGRPRPKHRPLPHGV